MGLLHKQARLPAALAILLGMAGWIVSGLWNPAPLTPRNTLVPAPYRIPKIPGGAALRMAMVHDVLMNRYTTHSKAWYEKRNDNARAVIDKLAGKPPTVELLNAMDDLAVGYQFTGQGEKAVAVMRDKLKLLPPTHRNVIDISGKLNSPAEVELILQAPPLDDIGRHQYSARANLGTFLNLQSFAGLLKHEPAAREMMAEGLKYVEESISINPGSHFGRERWQAILVRHFLALEKNPEFLTKYSMIGDRLVDRGVLWKNYPGYFVENPSPGERSHIRDRIGTYKPDENWANQTNYPYYPIPFDEPTLALIGTWTLGVGPNPHWSLALATLMDRAGQNHIAWEGYQRTIDMIENFSPDPAICKKILEHCKDRQKGLETRVIGNNDSDWQKQMLAAYQTELALGAKYQSDYHQFEADQIAAGVPLDDPHFYDKFFASRGPIASDPGLADDIRVTRTRAQFLTDFLPLTLLGIGAGLAFGILLTKRKPKSA